MITHITNAHIINPDQSFHADIRIENGKIATLEKPGALPVSADVLTLDAKDMYVLPGGIDPHVHLSLPTPAGFSADDFKTGSRAALAGGVTHIIDFVTPLRGQSLAEALQQRKQEAKDCITGLDFHMGISGWLPDMEKQMEICVKEHGIKSFKTYLAYRKNIGIGYDELEKVMQIAARLGVIVLVHAEEDDTIESLRNEFIAKGMTHPRYHAMSRPPESESRAVQRVIELVEKTQCATYLVHISAAESAEHIADARKKGLPLYAETCPQYLIHDTGVYEGNFEETAPFVFSPPARPPGHKEILWNHLSHGTFDTVATDHCPFTMEQKKAGKDNFTLIPNGAGGLEFRIPLLYHYGVKQNKISTQQWIQLSSSNAANIFGLKNKGSIGVGKDADLVLFNPDRKHILSASSQYQNCDINIYEGSEITGKPESVIVAGKKVSMNL